MHISKMFAFKQWQHDMTLSALSAGVVAILVAMTSSAALVFGAAQALGADQAEIASWMWAACIGCGITSLLPSLWLRKPVMIAWSTPGAVVLATAATSGNFTMTQAIGAFMVCAIGILLVGATGWFERVMHRIPMPVAAALLAGVLARFAMQAFQAAGTAPALVVSMLMVYLLAKCWMPRYAVVWTLLAGIVLASLLGGLQWNALHIGLAQPILTMPEWDWRACISLALPLFIVTMTSQNIPGVVAIKASGFELPISKLISLTGLVTLVLAPFGCFALNFSAITASICMGSEAHPTPAKRYMAAVVWGIGLIFLGIFGVVIAGLLIALPVQMVQALAGLALLSTIGSSLKLATQDSEHLEASIITFLVTLSGVKLAGVDSTVWGAVSGIVALAVMQIAQSRQRKR